MQSEQLPTVQRYREKARQLRLDAERAAGAAIRGQLLNLADLAEDVVHRLS